MVNGDVNRLLVVWHILLLTLEVNLHHYSLIDSLEALKKHCTSEEHPCSRHLGFLGRKLLNPAPHAPL